MTLMRWNPVNDMLHIQREMNRLMNDMADDQQARSESQWTPRVDVTESSQAIEVTFELPGIEREDIKLVIEDNVLSISGERKPHFDDEHTILRSERRYGAFHRTFSLPVAIDSAKVKARHKDGLLMVTMPKMEKDQPHEIAVNVG